MTRITRRSFLGGSVALGASLAACRHRSAEKSTAEQSTIVDVRGAEPAKMVAAALAALGGIEKFVSSGDRVVLKPNAGFGNPPEWATTTHPDIVEAVARACLEAGAKQVLAIEHPGGRRSNTAKRCGITAAIARVPGAELTELRSRQEFRQVKVEGGTELESVEVAAALLSADVFINLPIAKHHVATGVTFGLKNAMGVIYDRRVFHDALDLHRAIADLARATKPDLTILDATRALLTNGPKGPGDVTTPGRVIAGRDIVAVDAYGLTLAPFNHQHMTPTHARHILHAGEMGLGQADVGKLKVETVEI